MQQEYSLFSYNDFIGVPVTVIFLFLLLRWLAPIYIRDRRFLKFFYFGLFLRVIGVIANVLFYNYLQIQNDTDTYFTYGNTIAQAVSEGSFDDFLKIITMDFYDLPIHIKSGFPGRYPFADTYGGNRLMILFTAFFSYFSFQSYLAISIFFSVFGYMGCWLIFYRLSKIYPDLDKYFYIFIICWPSAFFFGSSIMKEPLCIGCLGIVFYHLYSKARNISVIARLLISIPFALVLYGIKSYLLIAMLISFVISYVVTKVAKIRTTILRRISYVALLVAFISPITYFLVRAETLLNANVAQRVLAGLTNVINFQRVIGHSKYDLGEIELTALGIIKYAAASLNVSLIRPYIFEINSLQLMISGSETIAMLIVMLFTFYKVKFKSIIHSLKNDAILQFCLLFVIIIGIQIGAISFNFGTLVRYKMPLVPFYFSFFIILLYKRNKPSPHLAAK